MKSHQEKYVDSYSHAYYNFNLLQANYKIQGAKLQYDIYALCLRLRDNTFRAEHEEKVDISYSEK